MAIQFSKLVVLAAAVSASGVERNGAKCEVLRSMEFQQHAAPKGVSDLLGPVVSLVSEKAEVGDIKIRWDGELHRVGTHKIVAENHGADDGSETCYEMIIIVTDTNECTVADPTWKHQCDPTSTCRNLVGSYACECSPSYFAAEGALFGCGGLASTTRCCTSVEENAEKKACLASFRCEPDRCAEVCAPTASCKRSIADLTGGRKAARYDCSCPAGQIGNGRRTGEGGGCARVDACAKVRCGARSSCAVSGGAATCTCDAGYANATDGSCVDDTLPTLKLKGPATVSLPRTRRPPASPRHVRA